MRNQIGRWLDGHLSESLSGMYRALLIGDRSRLDEKTLELFRRTGTFHILAISGLHMSVLAFLMYGCLYWLLSRSEWLLLHISVPKTALLLTMPGLVMYGTIAGMNTPVVRALIMSCTVIFAFCLNRIKSIAPLIGFAGFLILSIEPLQLFSASFILSFSAIIAIASLYPILNQIFATKEEQLKPQKLPEKLGRWIVAAMLVSTAATVVTLPIIANYFNRLTFLGPIANLVIEPLICLLSLPLGIIGMILIPITPQINSFFFEIGGWSFQLASWLGNLTAGLPGNELRLPAFPWWATFGYYFGLLLLITGRTSRYRYLGGGLTTVIAILSINPPAMLVTSSLGGSATTISILDVGQ
jgi:competence protein ComEC